MRLCILLCCLLSPWQIRAQNAEDFSLFATLSSKDSLLFQVGFNRCDLRQFEDLLSDAFNFYHDEAGPTPSKAAFIKDIRDGLCKLPYKPVRRLVPNSMRVYPLKGSGVLYGAIQEGEHAFYASEAGKPECLTSTARFMHLWSLEKGEWKLTQALSYNHRLPSDSSAITSLPLPNQSPQKAAEQKVFAITAVNIIPMTAGSDVMTNATVVIDHGKIASINGDVPGGATIIDGRGKWLIPGLTDMHVHIPVDGHFNTTHPTRAASIFTSTQDIMTPFVANGVTTVFDLNARAGHFGQRAEILRGDVIGPRMALAAMINGGKEGGRIANTPSDGRQAVRMAKAEGYEFIKVYSQLNSETYAAIVDEAAEQEMKVVGHIPNAFKGRIEDAFVPHFGMVAHAEELFKQTEGGDADVARLARLAKKNGTWLTPTLIIVAAAAEQGRSLDSLKALPSLQYVHPLLQSKWLTANNYHKGATPESIARLERMKAFNARLVAAFKSAGVPIVAGTDAGSSGVVWGFSLHDELRLLVEAGLTPGEALAAATRLPAVWLGIDSVVGTVERGKYADLILLDANPLADIGNTRRIAGVVVGGRWMDKTGIDAMLRDLSRRNAAAKDGWDWGRRGEY